VGAVVVRFDEAAGFGGVGMEGVQVGADVFEGCEGLGRGWRLVGVVWMARGLARGRERFWRMREGMDCWVDMW